MLLTTHLLLATAYRLTARSWRDAATSCSLASLKPYPNPNPNPNANATPNQVLACITTDDSSVRSQALQLVADP